MCRGARIDLLNGEEEARIREFIATRTWPQRWDGSEPLATQPFEDGGQAWLFGEDDGDGEVFK